MTLLIVALFLAFSTVSPIGKKGVSLVETARQYGQKKLYLVHKETRKENVSRELESGIDYQEEEGDIDDDKSTKAIHDIMIDLLIRDEPTEKPKDYMHGRRIVFCKPKSLVKWQRENKIHSGSLRQQKNVVHKRVQRN